jgi:hypothetical protein
MKFLRRTLVVLAGLPLTDGACAQDFGRPAALTSLSNIVF